MAADPIIRTCSAALALLIAVPAFAQDTANTDYVRARFADAAGLAGPAAAGYSRALYARPNDAVLAMRAYRQGLEIGDYALATRAASALEKAGVAPPDTALLALAAAFKAGDAPEIEAARVRLIKGPLSFLAAALTGPDAVRQFLDLAETIAEQDIVPLSISLTRAALLIDPASVRAKTNLAEALSRAGAHDLALAELAGLRGVEAARIAILRHAGRLAEALPMAKALAEKGGEANARLYGDVLFASDRFAAAAIAYASAGDDWEAHYLRGMALDRAGQWSEALPALRRAVALGPDQADALEYLGYAQVVHGESLPEAQKLLERAAKLKPEDPGISASLAWAYYTSGDITRALPLLEKAVEGDPSGARSNEHLGDAYWRVGRKYEARYAWSAAALYAENDAIKRIEGKIAKGL